MGLHAEVVSGISGTEALPPMPLHVETETLMELYQQGDFGAASALVARLSPQLYRFFAVELHSRPHADDLLQETWMRVHRVRHTYRPGEPALPWLYAIARHIRIDHYRRHVRRTRGEQPLSELARDPAAPEAGEGAPTLDELLAPLPEGQREVVEMLKIAGMSLEEVARATSSTVGSVKQKAHRAYKRLRETLGAGRPGASGAGEAD